MMARTVEEVSPVGRVQVKEDTGDDNDLLVQQSVKEVQPIRDVGLSRKRWSDGCQVEPDIEGGLRNIVDAESYVIKALQDIVSLLTEVLLQRLHLRAYKSWLKHGNGRFLEGDIGTTIQI